MPVIAVSNQKGGVGKTTSTLNVGAALQELGKRVLLVDLDPQGSLTVAAGVVNIDAVRPTIGEILMALSSGETAGPTVQQAIIQTPAGLDLVPANGLLCTAEISLVTAPDRESVLATALAPVIPSYDYVLIDCLPSLGLLILNALRVADGVVIPVQAEFLAVQGLAQIIETIGAVRAQVNPKLEIYGVVLTMADSRRAQARRVVESVRESLAGTVPVFETEVAPHESLKEATEAGLSVLEYDTRGRSAGAYRKLAREVAFAAGDAAIAEPRRGGFLAGITRLWRVSVGTEPLAANRMVDHASKTPVA